MKVTASLEGDELLLRKFGQMRRRIRARVLSKAAKGGADLVRDRAKELAPVDEGDLKRKGIKSKVTKRSKDYGEAAVGHDENLGWYGHFVELGTAPHSLAHRYRHEGQPPPTRRSTSSGNDSQHPGTSAQPHLQPAYDQKKDEVIDFVAGHLRFLIFEAVK